MFELQDDENGRLDLQERQQGDDNSNGRVEVSSAIHIAEGCWRQADCLGVSDVRGCWTQGHPEPTAPVHECRQRARRD